MKILKAEIYGFGKWVDQSFDFSSSSFLSFYGENESGKSTLQQFFLFIMFGLPPKKRQYFESKYSSRFGGVLHIEHEKEIYTIERTKSGVRVLTKDGEEEEDFLQDILYGLSRETFESIYAFTATQLSEIQQMKVNELNDVLFSVGLTGSTNIYKVEKALDQKLTSLYKSRGWKAEINEQLQIVEKMYHTIKEMETKEDSYIQKRANLDEMEQAFQTSQLSLKQMEQELRLQEKHLYVFSQKENYLLLKQERIKYSDIKPFPEDGLQRLERVKNLLLPVQSEVNVLKQQLQSYEQTYNNVKIELMESPYDTLLKEFMAEKMNYINAQKEIEQIQLHIAQMEEALREKLTEIPLQVEEIEDIVIPFHMDQTVGQIKQQEDSLQVENLALQEEQMINESEIERLEAEIKDLENELIDAKELEQRKTANKLYENEQMFQLKHQSQNEEMEQFRTKKHTQSKQLMYGFSMISLIGLVISLMIDETIWLIISVFVFLIGIGQYLYMKHMWETVPRQFVDENSNMSDERYRENEKVIDRQQYVQQQLFLLQNEYKKVLHANLLLDNKREGWKTKRAQLDDRIETECYQYPFLQQVEVHVWEAYIRYIRDIKELLQIRQENQGSLQSLEQVYMPLEKKRQALGAYLKKPYISVKQLEEMYERELEQQYVLQQTEKEISERNQTLNDLEQTLRTYEFERNQLFDVAHVEEEELFYKIAHENEQIAIIEQEMSEIYNQLEVQFTEEELYVVFHTKETKEQIENDVYNKKMQKETTEKELEKLQESIVALQYDIEQLEASGTLSEKLYEYEIEKTKLQRLVKEWSVHKVAQTALLEAKKQYQEKYFHAVIEKTSLFFEKITSGKYSKVFAPTEKTVFQVETNDQRRYRVDELSKGTIDQLYVALRLAMNVVMQEKVKVPLIIDDAFVHFDTVRSAQMVQLLKEISEDQQIILFTCKDYFAKQVDATHILKSKQVEEDLHA